MKKIFLLALFFLKLQDGVCQDYSKLFQSKSWYVNGVFYSIPRSIYFSSEVTKDYDSEVKFLKNGKYYSKSILRETNFDKNGNELPAGTVWEDSTITYQIIGDKVKFSYPKGDEESNVAPIFYFKILPIKGQKKFELSPIKPEDFK